MATRRTRVRRGARVRRGHSDRVRQGRSTRPRGRAVVRQQSARRRSRYGGRARTSQLSVGKSLTAVIAAAVVALAAYLAAHGTAHAATSPPGATGGTVAGQFVYTARTANDAAITLPGVVQDNLLQAGRAHQSIELTRVDSSGEVSTSVIDLTPRTGNSSNDPVLKVTGRADQVIDAKISGIETAVNSPAATTGDGLALYAGLTRTDFTGAPVTIFSSGLDLADPDDFRALKWSVPPGEVVAEVKRAGDLPALHGPVTFVVVPTAGPQPQLGQAQKDYLKSVWTALLTAAGATSVTFIDATGTTTASAAAPSAPTVTVPAPPTTPIPQIPEGPNKVTCTVPAGYFAFNTSQLADPAKTEQDLTPCITAALGAHATFTLDGWASYQGPLNANGQPEFNYPINQKLSKERVQTIADLLVNDLGVRSSAITRMTWHGNVDQPDPNDPSSPANQVVVITYTTK